MKSLFQLYREHQGKVSDKWSIYLNEYDRIFSGYRSQPVCMLEIGVQNGGSLEIWSKYFQDAQKFVGCDINPDCSKLVYDDSRIQVVVGDANFKVTEAEILSHSPNFDIIIDDGSHFSSDIVKSFALYFRHLKQGGVFVAEDLHCSYWESYEGGLYYPYSSIAFFKRLVDVISHEHWGVEKERKQLLRGFSEQYMTEFDESDLEQIHSIEFLNSVCVVHKKMAQSNVLGERFIAGQNDFVVSGLQGLGSQSLAQSQCGNSWSAMTSAPDEEWGNLVKMVSERDSQITSLSQVIAEKENQLNKAVSERDGKIAALNLELGEKTGHIAALYESSSWRLTRPLRWVSHQIQMLRRLARLMPAIIQRGGGVKNTAKKAMHVYQREGIQGLKHAVRGLAASAAPGGDGAYDRNDYVEWVRRYDTLTELDRSNMRATQAEFKRQPLISVLMPTYNPNPEWLIEAIESVRSQIYGNWELCIADDASTNPAILPILEKYASQDERIKFVCRTENGHISASSNSALELASGEWVALLDHDDLLSENALFWVVDCINRSPAARLIYSDEDKISEKGQRFSPYFKCDWNPDLFRSHNMICHLGVYEIDLIKQVGGFRLSFEGAQDYDLALRCSERLQPAEIIHIPRVLYHWRVHAESTAMSAEAKPYAVLASERALNEHFERMGVKGQVKFSGHGYIPVYDLPAILPLVSIIIPTRNGLQLLTQCISSIVEKTSYKNYEILIIDNGSDDPETLEYLENISKKPSIRVVRDDSPFNYSRLNNRAVQLANGEVIALVNNDIEVISPDWLTVMVSHALRPDIGAVGAKLLYSNDALQHGGVIIGLGGVAGHSHKHFPRGSLGYACRLSLTQNLSAVTAACLLIRKSIFQEVGGLDEDNLVIAFNDVDFCLRVREAGYRNVWTPLAELYHHESATRGFEDTPEKQERFSREVGYMKKRWGNQLLNDPAYSPNLTLGLEDFSYAWPPRVPLLSLHASLNSGQ